MNVIMVLSQAAARHSDDGTFSMLRAGLNQWWVQAAPTLISGSLCTLISLAPDEPTGERAIEVKCVNEADGVAVWGPFPASISLLAGRPGILESEVSFVAPDLGNYIFSIAFDGEVVSSLSIKVSTSDAKDESA